MAVKSEKQINSFIKGLITESNPLTYPENASMDEDNFVLNRDGSRSRRLGMEYEEDYQLNPLGTYSTNNISYHEWAISGGGSTTVSIGVVRVYNKLWFLNMLDRSPSTALLNGGVALEVDFLENAPIESTVINNALIVVGEDLPYPVRITYDPATDTITQTPYTVLVRDFWGVYDGLVDNERPTVLSNTHNYNLLNQGWSPTIKNICDTTPINCTYTHLGKYPSNSDVWHIGKVADSNSADFEQYSPLEMDLRKHDFTIAPKGKHIIDVFNRGASRQEVSTVLVATTPVSGTSVPTATVKTNLDTVPDYVLAAKTVATSVPNPVSTYPVDTTQALPVDKETGSFTTVAFYAGRVFYSGVKSAIIDPDPKSPNYSGYVFYSQTMLNDDKLGRCYQEADPTSDEISDIIGTDGGTIHIAEAINITALVATKSALLVFAENGIWMVSGGQANFSATDYQLSKISSIGTKNKGSIVTVNSEVYYWAKGGIFRIVYDDADGGLKSENLSLTSIQTLYNQIGDQAKYSCRGKFEEKQNTIRWLYNDSPTYAGQSNYNRELVLDLTLGAFYTNTIDNTYTYIAELVRIPDYAESTAVDEVLIGNDPVLVGTDEVVVNITDITFRESPISYLAVDANYNFTIAKYKDTTFHDWTIATGGTNYSSYLVTGYEIFGEIMRKKYAPYIMFYFDRTENGFTEVTGTLKLANPSSCLVQAQWNWTDSANSGKWGNQFQAYRLTRNYIPTGVADTFDYGDRVIVTKNKLRGSGRALSLKIQSEEGKDMKLLGWGLTVTGNSAP